jgi:hypothetical protein
MIRVGWIPLALVALLAAPAGAAAQPFEFAAKLDKRLGSTPGTLAIDESGVTFRSPALASPRSWPYTALKQVRIRSTRQLVLETYEDQSLWKLGADRRYEFDLVGGDVTPALVAFLLDRLERPVVTAVMPPLPQEALVRIAVKHQRRGNGSEGTFLLYDTALAYLTEEEAEARYWRLRDVASVLQVDPRRLIVTVYEGGGLRPYTFELKAALPARAYDALWQRVNAPARAGGSPRAEGAVAPDGDPSCERPASSPTGPACGRGGVR